MPAKSQAQQRLFGAAVAAKQGKKTFPMAKKLSQQMSEDKLKEFATKPKKVGKSYY